MMHELTEVRKLIIGGTAAYGLDLSPWRPVTGPVTLQTPYGESPAITLLKTDPGQNLVAFCSRHGNKTLKRSAAFLNHRATIWAAKMLGVETIFSWNGVGAIDESLSVGDLVVPADLIDFTRTRVITFGHPDLRPDRPGLSFPHPRRHPPGHPFRGPQTPLCNRKAAIRNSQSRLHLHRRPAAGNRGRD